MIIIILYFFRGRLNFKQSNTTYGFGYNKEDTLKQISSSNWLEIPLKISYNIGNYHNFGLALNYNIYLNSISNYSTEREFYAEGKRTLQSSNGSEISIINYHQLFKNNFSLSGSYEFWYKKIGIEINGSFGLTNALYNVEEYNGINTKKLNRLSFRLKYLIY